MNATIKTLADIPAATAAVLGFEPAESLVVMGLSGQGPIARVDLGDDPVEAVLAMRPAAHHWDRVMLIVFSDETTSAHIRTAFASAYPHVTVVDALDVTSRGIVSSTITGRSERVAEIAPGVLGDRIVAPSRDSVVTEAQRVTDPAEALRLAEGYYRHGDGARAWAYVDRARELGADPSRVEGWLETATNPRDLP